MNRGLGPESPMPPSFYRRKGFWDYVEFGAAFVAGALGLLAAFVPAVPWKTAFAGLAGGFAILAGVAKFVSKQIDERAKARKEEAERRARESQQAERQSLIARARDQARRMVLGVLEAFRERYFESVDTDEKYRNRVTLFVCAEADEAAGLGKRLVIFARAGVHANSTCSWPVDDDTPGRCRGLAGAVYFYGDTRTLRAECDWPADGNSEAKAIYASSLNMTVEEAEGLNVKSRAFLGALIVVDGRKWGVLLLDCNRAEHLRENSSVHKLLLNVTIAAIGRAISGAVSGDE